MKIVTVLGARPQFIKAECVSREFLKHNFIKEIIIHTGQHYDENMSAIFFEEMQIPKPPYNLNINSLPHGAMTGRMLEKIEKVLLIEKPNYVLVYGDTNSTLAGALAARKLNIRLAHVEGGLRNFDLSIPEEVNRIFADRISDVIFCSTEVAVRNLMNEGFFRFHCKIIKTGDLMVDAVLNHYELSKERSTVVKDLNLKPEQYVLCEFHRESNTKKENIIKIVNALNKISKETKIVFPVHPRTKKILEQYNIKTHFQMIEPVGYLDMLSLIKNSRIIITDSGGLQREGYILQKNCLLLMEYTPWEELTENGFSITTEIEEREILKNYKRALKSRPDYSLKLYGTGDTSKQIVQYFVEEVNLVTSRKKVL